MLRFVLALAVMLPGAISAQEMVPLSPPSVQIFFDMVRPVQSFDCSDRSCKALSSCEEACHKLLVCGQAKRDGDNDGIPCENLCRRRC
ncbi:MAG: hypothetical protein ACI9U6_002011 [Loktanella salsilacus]|jgi:hypothetical protein|uniref:excalibur calcium-binding domain-containing protein n=1 Tax=Loktanella salsilacus TaxID=195913 RepID=UPI00356A3EAC